jgi:hypothetical protein
VVGWLVGWLVGGVCVFGVAVVLVESGCFGGRGWLVGWLVGWWRLCGLDYMTSEN